MTRLILIVALCLVAATLAAQPPPVSGYTLKIFNQGATTPLTTTTLPASSFTCNQTPPPDTSNVANPTTVVFDDPANVGKVCLYTDPGTGPLLALPFSTGIYFARIAALNSAGTGPDSLPSPPFTRPGVVGAAPSGLKVYR